MKLDCGPTADERKALRKARLNREKARRRDWHPVFAWWPTRVGSHDCRWLEYIYRREVKTGETSYEYHFGCPPFFHNPPKPTYGWEYKACR